jgi:putative heme-binding domain-containing protein
LRENDEAVLRASVAAIRALPPLHVDEYDATPALLNLAHDEKQPADLRIEALAALPSRQTTLDNSSFEFLKANLESQKSSQQRSSAAFVLSRQKLSGEQLLSLTDELKQVGPMEVFKLLPAFDRATNETVGLKLIDSLKESKAAASLRTETLTNHISRFPESVKKKAGEFLASLATDAEAQKKHVDRLMEDLKGGDIRRGQVIFNGSKAQCSTCHAIGYQGGHVGPDLTKIGQVRTERDLIEAIVYPSATFVRSYEPMIVSTKSDEDYNGILKKDAPDEIILVTGPNAEVRITRNDVKEMRPGAVSLMPQGLDTQLTKQEMADLIAFLKATRW